jgi:SEC-C motif-containing protein
MEDLAGTAKSQHCPCGSGLGFTECCGGILAGSVLPATAAALMRSRYTAYALSDAAYLLKSWHPQTRPAALDFSGDDSEWLGLTLLRVEAGGADDSEGLVEFVAAYRTDGKIRQLREISRFVKQVGRWFYLSGDILPEPKLGRNDPCPCGSGKKLKKCCGS